MVDSFSRSFEEIASFPELYKGYREARKGKRYSGEVLDFPEIKDSIDPWKGHASHADTEELKKKYLGVL